MIPGTTSPARNKLAKSVISWVNVVTWQSRVSSSQQKARATWWSRWGFRFQLPPAARVSFMEILAGPVIPCYGTNPEVQFGTFFPVQPRPLNSKTCLSRLSFFPLYSHCPYEGKPEITRFSTSFVPRLVLRPRDPQRRSALANHSCFGHLDPFCG